MLPLATSAVTIGFGMLITFDTAPVDWRASWWLVPVGHAFIAVPFVVRTCVGVLRSVDPTMSDAAATLGASPVRAWRATVVPYLWRPLAVGAVLAASISLGEFGATSFLSRSGGETMPIAIEQLLGRTGSLLQAQGFALATLLAATTVILVVLVERLQTPLTRRARTMTDQPGLDVQNVTVSFAVPRAQGTGNHDRSGAPPVLDDLSLSVRSGEVVALLGPSGSGKSTLLRVIAGIIEPDGGRVLIHGVDVTRQPTHRRAVGMVFQDNQLFPHMSAIDNVGFGLKMAGVGRPERSERASTWLRRVGLTGFENRRVTNLSGGEAKRVALARTLATEPAVVLLDEPLTGLDRELHDQLAVELGSLLHDASATALLVTHDPDEAATIADRTVQLAEL